MEIGKYIELNNDEKSKNLWDAAIWMFRRKVNISNTHNKKQEEKKEKEKKQEKFKINYLNFYLKKVRKTESN